MATSAVELADAPAPADVDAAAEAEDAGALGDVDVDVEVDARPPVEGVEAPRVPAGVGDVVEASGDFEPPEPLLATIAATMPAVSKATTVSSTQGVRRRREPAPELGF